MAGVRAMTGTLTEKTTDRRRWCRVSGKFSYCNRKKALSALNVTRAAIARGTMIADGSAGPVSVYKCRACGEWHMTSQEQRAA